jgi:DNA-binding XRE family transcriptional regulator
MRNARDAQAMVQLQELLRAPRRDPIDEVLRAGQGLPADWKDGSVAELVRWMRRRCDMTQRNLAALSGLSRAKIAEIEGGQDVRWRTLCRLFAGFGCGLTLAPVSRLGADGLRERTMQLARARLIARRRRYPRK